MPTPILATEDLSFGYPGRPLLLDHIHLRLTAQDRVGLVGANGSGKTTLLRLLTGLTRPSAGRILFDGEEVTSEEGFRRLRQAVGFALQNAEDQLFYPTVLDDVAFGPLNLGLSPQEARSRAEATLAMLGLSDFAGRLTHRLSGGEMRLVALAGVLAMQPRLLLLDEPTTGLDPATRERLIAILQALPTARLVISHDWDFLEATCDRFLLLEAGRMHDGFQLHPHAHVHAHPLGSVPHEHPRTADSPDNHSGRP
ncbi:putative ABC transporter ATP-binding protein [Thermodesulfomicrobium sp. WS]|uniref:energy-coupling factor ABC transporter ATP-binding protein n=1 Tax=Thermodesulfomicrobium sp. WS TaxID=3004129 RepID=UPI002493A15B|nr:ABC transporter ATP-binding protein [Thermodesulfomicrobium sp. WS]BDV00534.1 putative ABC transporter ATP-binding protein [Thermodesulfomicrobium sp. WS]